MHFTIPQNLFTDDATVITVTKCTEDSLSMTHLRPFLDAPDHILGISAAYGKRRQLNLIAFSVLSRVLVVSVPSRNLYLPKDRPEYHRVVKARNLIQDQLLLNPKFQKFAFKMDQVAVGLHLELSIRISHAVDMLSVSNDDRESLQALMNALGGGAILQKKDVKSVFSRSSKSLPGVDPAVRLAQQAWAAYRAATLPHMSPRFASLHRIDTRTFPEAHLDAVANIFRHADRLEALKPLAVKNDVRDEFTVNKDTINLVCGRFPTRIRQSNSQFIRITMEGTGASNSVVGRAHKVEGRSVHINVNGPIRGNKIASVTTFGKDDPTCAESSRQSVTLKVLQCNADVLSNPFFQALWLPEEQPAWPEPRDQEGPLSVHFPGNLNRSQREAVERVLSDQDDDRIVMIQGPPGTGKTTVIAASVISHHHADSSRGIWVTAQSNVAVKNIAEKLVKENFLEFRLLVSKDFHFDWHEHLYEKLEQRVIRSDTFPKSVLLAERLLLGCKVILCTLSMFSNLNIAAFLPTVPVEMIILDEASQIESGNYIPVFHRFHATLSKLVFVGDDKQLPPFGHDDIPELRSVFEFPHLRSGASFLDTQYRMPHVIGNFISQHVYYDALLTHHSCSTNPKACRFIDVSKGEEEKSGHSWINKEEASIVVKLARIYEGRRMSFRILTPYDAQRTLIEDRLAAEKLQWGDKVFNVDSFQGNEVEHIIISVVRTDRPGFLKSKRRTNVMLTRCKETMIVCSNRVFLSGKASGTLVGLLGASIGEENWIKGRDVIG